MKLIKSRRQKHDSCNFYRWISLWVEPKASPWQLSLKIYYHGSLIKDYFFSQTNQVSPYEWGESSYKITLSLLGIFLWLWVKLHLRVNCINAMKLNVLGSITTTTKKVLSHYWGFPKCRKVAELFFQIF